MNNVIASLRYNERKQLTDGVANVQDNLVSLNNKIRDVNSQGHVVMAGQGSIVVIDSTVSNSFNTIKKEEPELVEALQTISGVIEKSGNSSAGQAWGRFLKEVSGERDKSVMSALWDKVVKLVPDITILAESAAKIVKLFA